MFENILVPIDGSENSKRALLKAKEVAECFNSKIILLNIISASSSISHYYYNVRYPRDAGAVDWPNIYKKAKTDAQELLRKSSEALEGLTVETVMLEAPGGELARAIVEFAQQNNIDLIIMGSVGIGSLRQRLYMGSVTTKVLYTTEKPVLVVQ